MKGVRGGIYREDDITPFLYHSWKGRYLVFLQPPDHAGRTQPTVKRYLIHHSVSTYVDQAADILTGMPKYRPLCLNCLHAVFAACNAGDNTCIVYNRAIKHRDRSQKQKGFTIRFPNNIISSIFDRE